MFLGKILEHTVEQLSIPKHFPTTSNHADHSFAVKILVLEEGLEPSCREAQDPKSCVYTNFTTRACIKFFIYLKKRLISASADSLLSEACAILRILSVPKSPRTVPGRAC